MSDSGKRVRSYEKLGIDIRPVEKEALLEYTQTGSRRQKLAANIILRWGDGMSQARTARELNCTPVTVKRYRDQFKTKGMAALTEGRGRSDLQSMANTLLDSPEALDNETLIRLTMAHISQIQSEGQGKLINECLSILQRCIDKKEKKNNIDSLGEALTEAMGNGS